MGRIGRGFSMMKQSFALLRKDKELMVLPLLSGVAIAIVVASFFFGMGLHKEGADVERLEGTAGVVTAFVLYVITYTVAFFFQAALVAGASERLRGGDPTVGSALGAASKRFLPIVMWAIVAATVGMILRAIQDKSELLGKIECPEMVANLHWGGADWSTLYLCACTSLYSVQTKTRGRDEPFMYPRSKPAAAQPAPALQLQDRLDFRIDGRRTALILQDMQNDVISDGGAFAASGAPDHARAQNVVANAARLAEVARAKGVLVLHVWFICEPGHPSMAQHAGLYQGLVAENAMVRGTWGAAPVAGLEPRQGDLIVEKMSMSAWETSRLETYLHHGGRDTIINCGCWTNMSVEHTARTGADKGFHMIVPQDACSTMNADWHRASIDYAMQNVATVTSVDAVIAALG